MRKKISLKIYSIIRFEIVLGVKHGHKTVYCHCQNYNLTKNYTKRTGQSNQNALKSIMIMRVEVCRDSSDHDPEAQYQLCKS